jgi:alkylation response protein AidB-like acyl-CoA dehydrogenase
VPADCPGLEVLARAQADGRFMADLVFAELVLPSDHLLASGEPALAAAWAAIDTALIGSAAELLGLSRRALDLTLDYLRTRTQFDRPIGAFQALQHRAVDLYIHLRIGESVMRQVLDALRHDPSAELRTRGASRVKARAARSARQITREAIQLHGAIGFTDDCEVGMHVRRALVLCAWLGSELEHRRRYARLAPAMDD